MREQIYPTGNAVGQKPCDFFFCNVIIMTLYLTVGISHLSLLKLEVNISDLYKAFVGADNVLNWLACCCPVLHLTRT